MLIHLMQVDSSVNFIVRPWVKHEDYWDVYWSITRKVKEEFDKQGVSIPFPQRDVHVHQETSGAISAMSDLRQPSERRGGAKNIPVENQLETDEDDT